MKQSKFTTHTKIGQIDLYEIELPDDAEIIHQWLTQPYAEYWGMLNANVQDVINEYTHVLSSKGQQVLVGNVNDKPSFLLEVYDPKKSELVEHTQLFNGDIGMHLLLAPAENTVKGFSYSVMKTVMHFLFSDKQVERVVVEPDERNHKIHDLNRRVGFQHHGKIKLKNKVAFLATCSRNQFDLVEESDKRSALAAALNKETWLAVNRELIKKALSEFSHERILKPVMIEKKSRYIRFQLSSSDGRVTYFFDAEILALDHWSIDDASIERFKDDRTVDLDAVEFIIEFNDHLNIPQDKLGTYLEEISSTLSSAGYKRSKNRLPSDKLATLNFQKIESEMTEGHPCFVANNGRIGFSVTEFLDYAPEAGSPVRLIWVAVHKEAAHFSSLNGWDYHSLLHKEFDPTLLNKLRKILLDKSLLMDNYYFMPVHPWQWNNKLPVVFAGEIANDRLIYLTETADLYQAQQSIRTFFNRSNPSKCYVKTALSVLNMGFMRGLSAEYMKVTPAINQWVSRLIEKDVFLQSHSFTMLKEVAAIGYQHPHFQADVIGDSPYRKMLSALWRESPLKYKNDNQQLMTMAALLHRDAQGRALLPELIKLSGLPLDQWLQSYFRCYLIPIIHCFYQHNLVFMPHGENLIFVMESGVPIRAIMKDIGEEVCLLNSETILPKEVERISVKTDDDIAILSIFTDVFDGFFRFMSAILVEELGIDERSFWREVATAIHRYQAQHSELKEKFKRYNLFSKSFKHSCLNRLQLRNNLQMVDLTDPAGALQFAGVLDNPIYPYRNPNLMVNSCTSEFEVAQSEF
ncbi:GNAT family N-acetyltransferase [Pleionea sediminis]|uniref:GNAT family N-acetyltransferase n=1 Tax=Pleionea sediminis TaxID=2569479 RepID=UPI0011855913|nr:GNAT family N-acetyltransferase [Pleionea sediminis]